MNLIFSLFYSFKVLNLYIFLNILHYYLVIKITYFLLFRVFSLIFNIYRLIVLCVWHVLKTWRLQSMEKIKYVKIRCVILKCLHLVMFMSINLKEIVELFKARGKEKMIKCFNNLKPNDT